MPPTESQLNVEPWVERRRLRAQKPAVSIVIPAKDEARNLETLLPRIEASCPGIDVLVVDDGSRDDTRAVCEAHGARVLSIPYSMGNGAAVKAGMRSAASDVVILMDADGQHDPADIPRLLAMLDEGFDMVVGARSWASQANLGRGLANGLYNRFAGYVVNQDVKDLTSGFRAVRGEKFVEFLHLLPNGFSYPTSSTMAFFRMGYPVGYLPIEAGKRIGKSHVKPLRDGVRFMLIIFKIGTLYSPFKLFFPISGSFFLLGLGYYAYTFISDARFTNMSALLFSTSVLVFLIGLVSEQVTSLIYGRDH